MNNGNVALAIALSADTTGSAAGATITHYYANPDGPLSLAVRAFVRMEASDKRRLTLPFSQILDDIHSLRPVKSKQHF
ncbi:hypothetical protein [Deinococcus sp.]|uniref:hypothetical protein n=1 Tax=Deinococcus sp. TaxID=47478 RepID=UPI002869D155|nr:hypothetical protein [Deinococcus sp.]